MNVNHGSDTDSKAALLFDPGVDYAIWVANGNDIPPSTL